MSTKVEQASDHTQTSITMSPATVAAATGPKISMFAKKSGFVIPKNKLSGSLVPIFRGKKGSSTASEEIAKQVQRKTRWGPDLTQDTAVRKGRALAYQTRVEQITQRLGFQNSDTVENQNSTSAAFQVQEASDYQLESEEPECLELEKREAIGEILKLNPSYKPPADYEPLLKEAKVPIPIKEYPGYNFIGLVFGLMNDTQKRLEKETGAKVRVYGTKRDIGEKVEVTSDRPDTDVAYEELHVHVSADTYEKVDAAVSLIELLVTPVSSVNPAFLSTTSTIIVGDSMNIVGISQGNAAASMSQGIVQPIMGSAQAAQSTNLHQYSGAWFPMGTMQTTVIPSQGFTPNPAAQVNNTVQVSSSPLTPANMPSLFGPRPVGTAGAGFLPQIPSLVLSGPQPQLPSNPFMPQPPPRNPFMSVPQPPPSHSNFAATPQLSANQPALTGHPQIVRPGVSSLPLSASPATFSNQPMPSAGWSQPLVSTPSSSGLGKAEPVLQGHSPIAGFPGSGGGLSVPIKPPFPVLPPQPSSSDFTFQPHRPQYPASQIAQRSSIQPIRTQLKPIQPPHGSQTPSFRPPMHNHPSPIIQGFLRPQVSNFMSRPRVQAPINSASPTAHPGPVSHGGFPDLTALSHAAVPVQPRNFSSVPTHIASTGLTPRGGGPTQIQQSYPVPVAGLQGFGAPSNHQFNSAFRPGGTPVSGAHQVYDPFSPTCADPQLSSNRVKVEKQENDPEYEDLMASVGVK